ncbi:MAG: hypothetical protein IPO77_15860 [Acidobacteria bacterium]|nr:hypothetical protein [Acidobacteriota bacterium]
MRRAGGEHGGSAGGVGLRAAWSSVRQRFDGYERDNETGLDFAQARYYNSMAGRFTSVDPLLSGAKFSSAKLESVCILRTILLEFIDPDGEELKSLR